MAPLDQFVAERGLADRVRVHYGVDQGDHERVAAIVAEEFGDEPLDLIIDDASHDYDLTRGSFELLFPLLRPGGAYIIEDWNWHHIMATALIADLAESAGPEEARRQVLDGFTGTPLSRLAIELVLTVAEPGDVVDDVRYDENMIVVRRGKAPLASGDLQLTRLYVDHFGLLAPPAG